MVREVPRVGLSLDDPYSCRYLCLVGDFDGELEFDKEGFLVIILGLVLDLTTLNKENSFPLLALSFVFNL